MCLVCAFTVKGWVLTPKKRVNRDNAYFATKLRMFGPWIIDEGPSLSMTDGRAVAHFMLVWLMALVTFPPDGNIFEGSQLVADVLGETGLLGGVGQGKTPSKKEDHTPWKAFLN